MVETLLCVCVCVLNFSLVLSDLFLSVLEYNLKEIAYAACCSAGVCLLLCFSFFHISLRFIILMAAAWLGEWSSGPKIWWSLV